MGIFSKPTYKVMDFPFVYDCFSDAYEESMENGVFDIEAYGVIDGEQKYLFGCYNLKKQELYEDGSLANIYGDERFLEMECLGYGINNTSCINRG